MWKINSWRDFKVKHIPNYPNQDHLSDVEKTLKSFPPLVFAGEVRSLKRSLAEVSDGIVFYYREEIAQKVFLSLMQIIFVILLESFYKWL